MTLLAAQIWAICTNLFLVLPVAALWRRHLIHTHMLEAAWFAMLAFVSLMHHVCDPATDLVWSCQNNRETVAFTERLFAQGAIICVVMPFVHQQHAHVGARLRLVLFPLLFFLVLVDVADGFLTFGVLAAVLLPLFIWAIRGKHVSRIALLDAAACGIVGGLLYGLANLLHRDQSISTTQQLWLHGAWHVPISFAMAIVLSELDDEGATAPSHSPA
jgi:hypothetical protein